mmetsp:Transcript_5573/g.24759  ORF Transcript_5573/g.24759 Transcript_5573/m.24759 type:complete len:281 (-) Transcript_5573:39-881(-)
MLRGILELFIPPVHGHLEGLRDLQAARSNLGDLELVHHRLVAHKARPKAIIHELLGVLLAHVVGVLLAEQRPRHVVAEPGGEVRILIVLTDHPHGAQKGPSVLHPRDNQAVPQRVELVAPVVHHAAQVRVDLPRCELIAVILAVVGRVELLEEADYVVKVRELAGEADDRRTVHLLDALDALVPLGRTITAEGIARKHDAILVLASQDGGTGHVGILRALVGPGLHGEGLALAVGRYVGSGRLVELVLGVVRGIHAEWHHAGADDRVVADARGNHPFSSR